MRNFVRVLLIDVLAPLAVIGALVMIGLVLEWPLWWVSVGSMLGLLVVEAMAVNFVLFRRDAVTAGTDDQRPAVRLMVVAVVTATLVAMLFTGYVKWFVPDREIAQASADVVRIATDLTVATTSFTPGAPDAAIEKAASFMAPDRVDALKEQLGKAVADLQKRRVTAQGKVISAGVEAIGPDAASVAVILRGVQTIPGQPPTNSVLALRVSLTKQDGRWFATDVEPINSR
jgi:hypothetical protein